MGSFNILEHTADGFVEVEGETLEDMLKTSAIAMFSLMVNISDVEKRVKRDISVSGSDVEDILMNFIKELIFLYSTNGELYSDFEIKIEEGDEISVNAICYGEPIDRVKHNLSGEVKMLTYHRFNVEKKDGGLRATMLFDM